MSSEENISSGKDEFTVGQLVAALKESQALVHPSVDKTLAYESDDSVATAADLEKFYAAINTINAPVTSLTESLQQRVSAGTVIAAISLAIQIAESLWSFFSGWDDKAVGDHCSLG
jgi:hypothetical protein